MNMELIYAIGEAIEDEQAIAKANGRKRRALSVLTSLDKAMKIYENNMGKIVTKPDEYLENIYGDLVVLIDKKILKKAVVDAKGNTFLRFTAYGLTRYKLNKPIFGRS